MDTEDFDEHDEDEFSNESIAALDNNAQLVDEPKISTFETDSINISEEKAEVKDPIEEKARLQGWKPKEEFKGDPDIWCDAKEYIHRGSYLKRIDQLEKLVKSVSESAFKMQEDAYNKAIADLKMEKLKAKEINDLDAFEKVIEKEQQLRQQQPKPIVESKVDLLQTATSSDVFKRFEVTNPWIKMSTVEEKKMFAAMQVESEVFYKENPHLNPKDHFDKELAYISKRVREEYPNYSAFKANEKREEAPAVLSGGSIKGKSSSQSISINKDILSDSNRFNKLIEGLDPYTRLMADHMKRNNDPHLESYLKEMLRNKNKRNK